MEDGADAILLSAADCTAVNGDEKAVVNAVREGSRETGREDKELISSLERAEQTAETELSDELTLSYLDEHSPFEKSLVSAFGCLFSTVSCCCCSDDGVCTT